MLISPKLSLALPQLTAETHLVWEMAGRCCHYQPRLPIQTWTHTHTAYTNTQSLQSWEGLAATWESWSTQLPPSAVSSELFSHFPLIQLLVAARVHRGLRRNTMHESLQVSGGGDGRGWLIHTNPPIPLHLFILTSVLHPPLSIPFQVWSISISAPPRPVTGRVQNWLTGH